MIVNVCIFECFDSNVIIQLGHIKNTINIDVPI